MKTTYQNGFAHAFLIMGLVVALVGALGFVFWQNFIYQEPTKTELVTTTDTSKPAEASEATTSIFRGKGFSFEYPSEGWKAGEMSKVDPSVDVKSADYKENGYMDFTGAVVNVSVVASSLSVDQDIETTNKSSAGYSDFKKFTTDKGDKAYTYKMSYEGTRYGTSIFHGDRKYTVVYEHGSGSYDTYAKGYDAIVSTLSFDD